MQNCCCDLENMFWEKIPGADVVSTMVMITHGCNLDKILLSPWLVDYSLFPEQAEQWAYEADTGFNK